MSTTDTHPADPSMLQRIAVPKPSAPAKPIVAEVPKTSPPARKAPFPVVKLALAGGAVLAAVAGVAAYRTYVAPFESTDDAFIATHVVAIAPQISGRVARLLVADNQDVHQGQELLEIDPADTQARLDQAAAALAGAQGRRVQAQDQCVVDQAHIDEAAAALVAAGAEAVRADADAKRYIETGPEAVSGTQRDLATAQANAQDAQRDVARHRLAAAQAQLVLSTAALTTADAEVARAEAMVRQAELDHSYTRIVANADGVVTNRTVEAGAYVQTGQPLLALVPHAVWVVANFKETQLTAMRAGQAVTINVDAYPDHVFHGHVDSIQSGSGAAFSLLPPENATGNYVKVVQRLPVKIVFDDAPDPRYVLGPGMSVVPSVRVY